MTTSLTPRTASRLSLADWWRREWFLQRLSAQMPNIPRPDWRALSRNLRQDLSEAAAQSSMKQAIGDLGPINQLADEYSKALELLARPDWISGLRVTGRVWLVLTIILFTYAIGLWDGAEYGGITEDVTRNILGVTVFAKVGEPIPDTGTYGMIFTPWGGIVPACLLVLFIVTSRAWRIFPGLRPHAATD